jgi:hypothetical protein
VLGWTADGYLVVDVAVYTADSKNARQAVATAGSSSSSAADENGTAASASSGAAAGATSPTRPKSTADGAIRVGSPEWRQSWALSGPVSTRPLHTRKTAQPPTPPLATPVRPACRNP